MMIDVMVMLSFCVLDCYPPTSHPKYLGVVEPRGHFLPRVAHTLEFVVTTQQLRFVDG